MTKSRSSDSVGDTKMQPLAPNANGLRQGAARTVEIPGDVAGPAELGKPLTSVAERVTGLASHSNPGSCHQTLWFSFFFDGTGNNRDADIGSRKHSNVVKLHRTHVDNDLDLGIYSLYIPGVGTYCKEAKDEGGTTRGKGTGYLGEARIEYAIATFDRYIAPHLARANSPTNRIVEINISAFGFSRGAALARAFINSFLKKRCTVASGTCHLSSGTHKVRIRFLGLFDTVASVGMPMSANNTSKLGTVTNSVEMMIHARFKDMEYVRSRPDMLAFAPKGTAGADPAPGKYDGHMEWGALMNIPHFVEEVRHFVAGHELRNSFPVESVSTLINGRVVKPPHFFETVYPGVHSDVGGSYRPGEGGREEKASDKLGLIPLMHMYQHALQNGVPLMPIPEWEYENHRDFATSTDVVRRYNYYMKNAAAPSSIGAAFNKHMALYYAWRFQAIRRKLNGDRTEAQVISRNAKVLAQERHALDEEVELLGAKNDTARQAVVQAKNRKFQFAVTNGEINRGSREFLRAVDSHDQEIRDATLAEENSLDKLLRAKARRDALPNMDNFQSMLDLYDKQLLKDAEMIWSTYSDAGILNQIKGKKNREDLRPHYEVLMRTYENEFKFNKGMRDKTLIEFFDLHVHDSLAGFALDATLPSDPRVIYVGEDEKLQYASAALADGEALA